MYVRATKRSRDAHTHGPVGRQVRTHLLTCTYISQHKRKKGKKATTTCHALREDYRVLTKEKVTHRLVTDYELRLTTK